MRSAYGGGVSRIQNPYERNGGGGDRGGNRWDQAPRQMDGGGGPGPYDMLALAYGGEDRWGRGGGGGGSGGGGYGGNGGGYGGGYGGGGGYGSNPPPPPGGYPGGGDQPPLPGARSSGYGGVVAGSRGGEQHIVKMRGLPFKVDIAYRPSMTRPWPRRQRWRSPSGSARRPTPRTSTSCMGATGGPVARPR
jgi:hypothetical protein